MVNPHLWNPPADALPLWEGTPPGYRQDFDQPVPTLMPFLVDQPSPAPAVIVAPGGGYINKVAHESANIAQWLNTLGISAFVLDYRVTPYHHPIPLLDARRAVQLVRAKAGEWAVDGSKVGMIGFSAGGHLTSAIGTNFRDYPEFDLPQDAVSAQSFIPNALILCYAVTSFLAFPHRESANRLLGPDATQEMVREVSSDVQVTAQTPPTFLMHTFNDEKVPVEQALLFAKALASCKVPYELHIFSEGKHGVALAKGHPAAEPWTLLCARWLSRLGFAAEVKAA